MRQRLRSSSLQAPLLLLEALLLRVLLFKTRQPPALLRALLLSVRLLPAARPPWLRRRLRWVKGTSFATSFARNCPL